jgi:hypothetical protein
MYDRVRRRLHRVETGEAVIPGSTGIQNVS